MKARQFKKQMLPKNSGVKFKPIGIVLHETACPGASAQDEYNYFCKETSRSAHAFIDEVEDLQIIPWDIKAYHAKSPANEKFIGIEMCHPQGHKPEEFKIIYWSAVDAFARLYRYILNIKIVTKENCMSHYEVTNKWKITNHTDPTGIFNEYGYSMDRFRADVQYRLDMKWEA